jgi:hypothetical protein
VSVGLFHYRLNFRERLAWRESIWAAAYRSIHHDPVGQFCTSSRMMRIPYFKGLKDVIFLSD